MRLLRRGQRLRLLKITIVLGSLWILSLLGTKTGLGPTYSPRYNFLDYTDADSGPEKVCNCSAILQGDTEELEQAKLLTISKDFRKSVRIPDEYYVNATQDCRFVALIYRFVLSWGHTARSLASKCVR